MRKAFMCGPILLVLSLAACVFVPAIPPAPAPVRLWSPVSAPFAETWMAAVDAFADKNIGIRTIDRSSGLIVADPVSVPAPVGAEATRTPSTLADCGRDILGMYDFPTSAVYNVRVRGDSLSSTVLVSVRWVHVLLTLPETVCASSGLWETAFEKAIKDKAEGRSF